MALTDVGATADDGGRMARSRTVAGYRMGALEAEVLSCLWEAPRPLSVRDVVSRLKGRRRAYTTVLTVLTRLHEKGLVQRIPAGRAHLYRATGTPDELVARRIRELVAAAADPQAVLAHFVDDLADDPALLRMLDRLRSEGRGR